MTELSENFNDVAKPVIRGLVGAVRSNNVVLVRDLLQRGADPDEKNEAGFSPLLVATLKKRPDLLRVLIEHHADINVRTELGRTVLMYACKYYGREEMVQLLLAKGAKLDVKDNDGLTALDHAQRSGNQKVVQMLEDAAEARVAAVTAEKVAAFHAIAEASHRRLKTKAVKIRIAS